MTVDINDLIVLPVSEESIDWALKTACAKYQYRPVRTAYDRIDRTSFTALDDKVRGDLAKNVIIEWLIEKGIKNIVEYDRIRTDDFMERDTDWDLTVGDIKVEVKSSLPFRMEANHEIVNRRDIKIIAKRAGRITFPENLSSDLFIQIYFRTQLMSNPISFESIMNLIKKNDFKKIRELCKVDSRLMQPIAFAWATKEDVKNFRTGQNDFWGYSGFTYWKCPICKCRKIKDLPRYFSGA